MNAVADGATEGRVDQTLAFNPGFAFKYIADGHHLVMALAVRTGASVTPVQVGFVHNQQ